MSEEIRILEGGLTRKLIPIDKIKTNTSDGNGAIWVPGSKANTGVLHASENGVYIASEDGYEAYSEVIVRVTKDSFDGDTSFEDWDYETPDMDLSNWDPETVEEFENDPEGFDEVFNDEDEWKDIDKPIDIKMNNPKIKDTKISGIDPVSGNPMEVGLDENGFLTEKTLPSAIKIEVPPTKTEYSEGDTIDFTGIKVFLLDVNGEHFTSEEYPTGEIPFEELIFPVTNASGGDSGDDQSATSDLETGFEQPIKILPPGTRIHRIYSEYGDNDVYYFECRSAYWKVDDFYHALYASESESNLTGIYKTWRTSWDQTEDTAEIREGLVLQHTTSGVYIHNGKTAHFIYGTFVYSEDHEGIEYVEAIPPSNIGTPTGADAWTMVYGEISGFDNNSIPVQWIRTDGVTLEDTFDISVLEGEM